MCEPVPGSADEWHPEAGEVVGRKVGEGSCLDERRPLDVNRIIDTQRKIYVYIDVCMDVYMDMCEHFDSHFWSCFYV